MGEGTGEMSHFDEQGASRMVDVGGKPITRRVARASAVVGMAETTLLRIRERSLQKGDVVEVARLAGIMATKRTSELIPLCHPLPLETVTVTSAFPTPHRYASSLRSQSPAARGSKWRH